MLETSKERVELLKIGITGKTIERLYIVNNDIKIIRAPIFFQLIEIECSLPEKIETSPTSFGKIAITSPPLPFLIG